VDRRWPTPGLGSGRPDLWIENRPWRGLGADHADGAMQIIRRMAREKKLALQVVFNRPE
jgi:hypothetical protein